MERSPPHQLPLDPLKGPCAQHGPLSRHFCFRDFPGSLVMHSCRKSVTASQLGQLTVNLSLGKKSSDYWPGNIAGQGAHFQGSDLAGKQTFPRGHSFRLPSRSRPGTQPLTRSPAHWPSPPFPEPAPRDLPGTGPRGGLVLSSFPPLPYLHPALRPPRVPGLRREEGTHLVGVTCCPGLARESPPGSGARRGPQPGQAALAPHPRPAPAAGREGGTGFS